MLSPLSRGYGTWSGRVEYSQSNAPSRENTFPSIGERNLTGISLSASIGTKLSAPAAPLQPPQPPTREPSYGEMYLPKTYLTRKGALLLFTAPESELDDSDFNARWQRQRLYKMRRDRVAKLIDLSLRLGNLTRLSNSVLQYGNQDFDPQNASISDEKNKQFLKFLQNLDQKEVDTHAKPGGDLEFYLRDLKSRGSARYVVSGDTYLPKSRISQELQALLQGLDANCPPSFSQEASILGERSHSRLSDQFTRPVSRASSRAQSPGSAPPSTPKSYNVLSCKKLTASIKSSNYLGRPSSTEPLKEDPPEKDALGLGISPAEEGTDGSGLDGYTSPLTRKLFRMPGTQPSVAGSSIAEEEESLDHLSRTLKERATSPGMPLIYQGREVKGCSGEGKGDGEGQDLHKGEVDKFEFEGKRVTEVKYSEPDDVINAFIESDPLDEFSEDKQEINEVSTEISQKKLSHEDMTVVEDDSIHVSETDRSGTVDQSDVHIVKESSDHEAEEHDDAHRIEKQTDNLPEETVFNGYFSSEHEVEEEQCTETHSMSEKLSQKEDDKMSMISGQTDLTSEKASIKVTGVSHVEIKVIDKVAGSTREEVDLKEESDLVTEEIDKSSKVVTNQTDNNQKEVEVLEVVKDKEEKEEKVVVVGVGEHMKMGEVTGEESEDEDKVDEVLLERFRRGGSLFSMQSEDVLAQYQETILQPSERDNLERQNETKEEEVKRPKSAKSKASVSSRSSSASRSTSARQKAQSVSSRPSSAMNRNVADKSEVLINQSMGMVSKELVENEGVSEVLEKEFVENEGIPEVLEKEPVENEGKSEVLEKELVENEGMSEVPEKELVENEGISEVPEKELVENEDMSEVLEKELVENEDINDVLNKELIEDEDIYEVLEKHAEDTEANTQKPLMSETQVAFIGEDKIEDENKDSKNNEEEIIANKIVEATNYSLKPQNMNKETLDEKEIIHLLETHEVSTKSEVSSMMIAEADIKPVSTENDQASQQIILEPVKGQDVNTKTCDDKAMLDVPENMIDHQNYLSEISRTEKPIKESKINHMDQNITDVKSGKIQRPPSSKPIKSESHSTLAKITAKSQEAKKSDIRKPVVASSMKGNETNSKMNTKVKLNSNSSILKQRGMTQVHKKDEANNLDGASKQLETETDVSSKSELSHLTQLAQSIGGKVPKAPGKGKKLTKNRQKSSTSLDKTDTVSETTSSVGSKRRDSLKIPEHMKDALTRRPSLSKEELEKEMERMSEIVDATLSGPTLHSIGEGLTEEELELAKQILQEKLAAAKEKIDDPKGQGKKSPTSKSASSRKSKKKDDKSDIEKEQEAIRERHEREKKNREEEARALQEKIAERKAMLKQQKDLSEAKTKELQEEMDRLQQEADEIQRTEDDVRAQLTEMKRKQREERQARKNEMLEKKKQEIAAKREKERKEAEEKRKKEQEMHEKIADAEMRRRLREEEERNREEEERLAEERYLEEIREQQRLAEEEEERARELERQAEEEAMQRLVEERNEAERQKRVLMEEKMRLQEESLREQELELERQRQLEEEERKKLEEEQARKEQEMARIKELRMMEEKAMAEMQIALEQKRTEAILRRDKNLEARQNISQLRYRQAITRSWVFSYFIRWPRETFEQPIGGKPKPKRMQRAKTPKPDSGAQKPS